MESTKFCMEAWNMIHSVKSKINRIHEPILQQRGLTNLQALTLFGIQQKWINSVGCLSRVIQIGQANASTLCKRLEQDGFLLRTRGQSDERVVMLSLTEKGEETLRQIQEEMKAYDHAFGCITDEQKERVLNGLQEALNILNTIYNIVEQESDIHVRTEAD